MTRPPFCQIIPKQGLLHGTCDVIDHVAHGIETDLVVELETILVLDREGEQEHGEGIDSEVIDERCFGGNLGKVHSGLYGDEDFLEAFEYFFLGHSRISGCVKP